jgi:hypothetical protein
VSDDRDLRASDAQRDRAAAELRDHFAAGRLTEDELSDRLDAAYRARTVGELGALRHDLPPLPVTRSQSRAELAERRAALRRHMLQEVGGALTPFFICVVIWAASGAEGSFWPIWVALPAFILLIRNGWRLYGPEPELDRLEKEAERERRERRAKRP